QFGDFNASNSYDTQGNYTLIGNSTLTRTFQPFDSALGTLQAVSIRWTLDVDWTFENLSTSGSHSINSAGTMFLNNVDYNGGSGGGGYTYNPDFGGGEFQNTGARSYSTDVTSTYDPANLTGYRAVEIFNIITGPDPFLARYTAGVFVNV